MSYHNKEIIHRHCAYIENKLFVLKPHNFITLPGVITSDYIYNEKKKKTDKTLK